MFRWRPLLQATLKPKPKPRPLQQYRSYAQLPPRPRPQQQYQRFQGSSRYGNPNSYMYRWVNSPGFLRDCGIISAGGGVVYVYNLEEVPVCHEFWVMLRGSQSSFILIPLDSRSPAAAASTSSAPNSKPTSPQAPKTKSSANTPATFSPSGTPAS